VWTSQEIDVLHRNLDSVLWRFSQNRLFCPFMFFCLFTCLFWCDTTWDAWWEQASLQGWCYGAVITMMQRSVSCIFIYQFGPSCFEVIIGGLVSLLFEWSHSVLL
jgi:hypothetical protein